MKRVITSITASLFLLCFTEVKAQVNHALTATANHSGGGVSASGYGPELYNNGVIPQPCSVTGTYTWGWVTTSGWIDFTWSSPKTISKVVFHKANRPMTTCTFQYWNGTAFVNFYTYNNASAPCEDSVTFPPVTTTVFRMNAVAGSSNPNHREIQIYGPSAPNDLSANAILQPLNAAQICANNPVPVKVRVYNAGTAAQSNFTVSAEYSGTGGYGILSGIYTGTLAPFATDSIVVGVLNLLPGSYALRAFTYLALDTNRVNDTVSGYNISVKPAVPVPNAVSDTVCAGMNASLLVKNILPGTIYQWYSAPVGGSVVFIGDSTGFSPLVKDTIMYVAALSNGCLSPRVAISAAIGPPPVVKLGNDTSFCESIPLILNAGNPGGKYLWSTGDGSQTISLTNISGKYWVRVDKYCVSSDTINVLIDPLPFAAGISYVRTGNAYHFTATAPAFVNDYLWIFGDGMTSSSPNPTHTFGSGINVDLTVRLVVANECGTDTVFRKVPTSTGELGLLANTISVYPNPASDQLFVQSETLMIEEIYIIDHIGKVVFKQDKLSDKSAMLNLSSLSNGKYFMRVSTVKGSVYKPFVILH